MQPTNETYAQRFAREFAKQHTQQERLGTQTRALMKTKISQRTDYRPGYYSFHVVFVDNSELIFGPGEYGTWKTSQPTGT